MDIDDVEAELATLAERLTAPLPGECLHCYLTRVVRRFGCTSLRFTERWARTATTEGEQVLRWAERSRAATARCSRTRSGHACANGGCPGALAVLEAEEPDR